MKTIKFTINGKKKSMSIDIRCSLLEVLREQIGMTGAKEGCGVGECGACSVLVNDLLVDSCIYLAVWADGKSVRTVEGECRDGELTPVQKAYVEKGAVQCGFCTPGFVMASTRFKEQYHGKDFNRDDIRREHAGNICRCTGYESIIEAVEKSMEEE
jgi:xanthine dehydrogenase iron-sulfur-binding subunit